MLLSLRCPSQAPQLHSPRGPGRREELVSPQGVAARLCRYHGLNASSRLGLAHTRLITDISLVRSLARQLNSLPPTRGTYSCPMDDGSEILLVFGYVARSPERVTVGVLGCKAVTNGHTGTLAGVSPAGVRLVKQLTRLTR